MNTHPEREINIEVPVMVRLEGEGALSFQASNGKVEQLHLRIYEPPRLFEEFLVGRNYTDVPTITARICGICPIAYQMTSILALEKLFDVEPGPWVYDMRRLLYCGEWLQSHALHIHLLAAPDFLGFDNAIDMAEDHPETVTRGMRLQALGNEILRLLGGRSVHPIGLKVGGFHKAPSVDAAQSLLKKCEAALDDVRQLVAWCAQLNLPEDQQQFTSVAIHNENEYAIMPGRLRSDAGLNIGFNQYADNFAEEQVPHSTAFYSRLNGHSYFLGPLARVNLNFSQLPGSVKAWAEAQGLKFPSADMFHNVVARAIECHYALEESIRILKAYQLPESPFVEVVPKAGVGEFCTEAPRGMIYHRYQVDASGSIRAATIIPPTSQNQLRIEENLKSSVERFGLNHTDDELRLFCEKIIRNYDPCISCSVHFLKLDVDRC
ncbi:Ni/Fe hydrogenase subunit alpha [Reinekea marinisedimentorum]|uniref:Coenzyme F420-reducing hydrogenase alpha subunit n=1 Tax=Reinekea marinisedimentorum TaxID=230495 RepID=A0A4R3I4V8_9GAMM|nr:nickel-dependent hydrogenase large subunit [Reinekea marinisedimentorum]TCS40125.1 coenzyme F420-reducing hydrogenase alpha subunit [Reinekea marinisedimentorum]